MNPSPSITLAHSLGYRVTPEGVVISPAGVVLRLRANKGGYLYFSVGRACKCRVHRLQAWQKFGEEMFKPGLEVRHLDGNPKNNSADNLALGTSSQNAMDKSPETRRRVSSMTRQHEHAAIIGFYNQTGSYRLTMAQFGITSKGTMSYIVRKSMAAQSQPIAA